MSKGIKSFASSFVLIFKIVYNFIKNFKKYVLFYSTFFKDKISQIYKYIRWIVGKFLLLSYMFYSPNVKKTLTPIFFSSIIIKKAFTLLYIQKFLYFVVLHLKSIEMKIRFILNQIFFCS